MVDIKELEIKYEIDRNHINAIYAELKYLIADYEYITGSEGYDYSFDSVTDYLMHKCRIMSIDLMRYRNSYPDKFIEMATYVYDVIERGDDIVYL